MEKMIKQVKVKLFQGDITDQDVDAIVNAANDHLWMGAGVAGAIKKKGGAEIEQEAMGKGPIPVGQAVATKAGGLKAKYVIHAAVMGQDLTTSEKHIRDAVVNSLKLAEELKISSIAFPALGTGVGGFPIDECARIMLELLREFSEEAEFIKEVRFVLFDRESYEAWSIWL
jgi:O-acetyl-ADP-ribose deacetylase (regulator of RNase III)